MYEEDQWSRERGRVGAPGSKYPPLWSGAGRVDNGLLGAADEGVTLQANARRGDDDKRTPVGYLRAQQC